MTVTWSILLRKRPGGSARRFRRLAPTRRASRAGVHRDQCPRRAWSSARPRLLGRLPKVDVRSPRGCSPSSSEAATARPSSCGVCRSSAWRTHRRPLRHQLVSGLVEAGPGRQLRNVFGGSPGDRLLLVVEAGDRWVLGFEGRRAVVPLQMGPMSPADSGPRTRPDVADVSEPRSEAPPMRFRAVAVLCASFAGTRPPMSLDTKSVCASHDGESLVGPPGIEPGTRGLKDRLGNRFH